MARKVSMPNIRVNYWLAFIIIVATFLLFGAIIFTGVGGENALFAILGYVAGWATAVVIFFFRTAPTIPEPKP
jgi:hypothetical protein